MVAMGTRAQETIYFIRCLGRIQVRPPTTIDSMRLPFSGTLVSKCRGLMTNDTPLRVGFALTATTFDQYSLICRV